MFFVRFSKAPMPYTQKSTTEDESVSTLARRKDRPHQT
jgi:hypothetical protein